MKNKVLLAATACLFLFVQCNFQKIGSDTGKGFNENTKSIARNLVAGVNEGLADPAFKKNLAHLLDSLIGTAGGSARTTLVMLKDSLLTDDVINYTAKLVEEATGAKLKGNVDALTKTIELSVANLLGPATREKLQQLVASAMNEILNDRLQNTAAQLRENLTGAPMAANLALLRDTLLNEKTNVAIRNIVDSAMMTIAYRMKNDVKDAIGDNASFIQKYAGRLLILVGVIALVIIIVVWRLKEKYAKMTTVLASQIYAIPDQTAYDELTTRIKEKATIAGVEPSLRKVLGKNGMLGKESRESWQQKKAVLLKNTN